MKVDASRPPDFLARVEKVRHFNRFYTRQIGLLQANLLKSPFSLTEARVLYELAHRETTTASELSDALGLDAGYLSRILRGFHRSRLISKRAHKSDARQSLLSLSQTGARAFAKLNQDSRRETGDVLGALPEDQQLALVDAMARIESILGAEPETGAPYLLRPHQPGDMGWVIYRHGVLYSQEYGWNEEFEALVADIAAKFIQNFDPKWERCWIAEKDGENVGSVFLVKQSKTVGKLRLLIVEPSARGLGIGKRLVKECVRTARQLGYRKLTLWTQASLRAACQIYVDAGFTLVKEEKHHSFGHDLTGQYWEKKL